MTGYILSNPKPNVQWVKVKTETNGADRIIGVLPTIKVINDTFLESTLEMTITSQSDLGIYECRANNIICENYEKVELKG
ncbi:hypothetical protein B4U80_12653 [Leptotrombidium deliense]|uniref:Ig-like domain-containing protein n=1 Tax=Leptotrombidium deliense TaxID=299467 RepID=A0A443QAJ4_9ACAR|nr:hypothetical protein B4U80_12653 [Leptotrombidium deliense]